MILIFIFVLLENGNADNIIKFFPDLNISSNEIKIYKKIIPSAKILSNNNIKDKLLKQKVFAKAFVDKYGINNDTKIEIRLLIEQLLAQKYIEKWKQKHQPNEAALKSFYLDHKDRFKPLPKIDLSTIKLSSLKEADRIYLYLKSHPEDFDKIARSKSLDKQIHYRNIPLTMLSPEVRIWVDNHGFGEISEPFKIGSYYYIDRLDNKKENNVSFEALKNDIKDILESAYISERIEKEYKKLKKRYIQ